MLIAQSLFGLLVLLCLAWIFSENRRNFPTRTVLVALGLQAVLIMLTFHLPPVKYVFVGLNWLVIQLQAATNAGTGFVFGFLGGAAPPFKVINPASHFYLAFQALPLILVMGAVSALLYYWRILPFIVRSISRFLELTLGVGGAVGIGTGSNIFVGMVEAPLLVRPYLAEMTRSELFTLMTGGMATIAGTVMALYASFLGKVMPDAMGHILIASILSAPAAIMVAQIMIPETGPVTAGRVTPPQEAASAMDAITRGTTEGVRLVINVTAMLIVLVALVHLVNTLLGIMPVMDGQPLTLQRILGWLFAPIVWLMGLDWTEATVAGRLMGVKTILNELLAYLQMAQLPPEALSPRSKTIMVYALCGFANFGSLGIMLGGLSAMVPERRAEIVGLGLKSLYSGTLATCLTGAMVGIFL